MIQNQNIFEMKVECKHSLDSENYTSSLQGKQIFKDQCMKTFHEPTQEGGLFVCMKCFNGFCPSERDKHAAIHNHPLFINVIMTEKNVEEKHEITKVAIGKEGGALGGPEYQTTYKVYCAECKSDNIDQASKFDGQVQSLAAAESPFKKSAAIAWELEIFPCEHTLTLVQSPVNKDLSKCASCDLSTNLWLCLTCGNTGCGRKNWDGSGGNNHAIDHFETTKHPLVVKLGTITAEGDASLYCYACDNDVKDDNLTEHLAVLGIRIESQKKTEKTMVEMTLDYNLNFSLGRLVDNSEKSIKMYGPEYTGMNNIGNSCYLNSVVQTLNSLPEFRQQYFEKGYEHLNNCQKIPSSCFYCHLSKVAWGLNSGKYSEKKEKKQIVNDEQVTEEYQQGIKPFHFKVLLAQKNVEFLSNRQQDALEYLQWVFDRLAKEEGNYGFSIPDLFNYIQVNRMVCTKCNNYKLVETKTNQVKFPVPPPSKKDIEIFYESLEEIKDEKLKESKKQEDPEYPLPFDECLNIYRAGDSIEAKCPKCEQNTEFICHQYMKSSPKYLLMIPNRFYIDNWVPKKKNALLKMPQQLNMSEFWLENAKPAGELMKQSGKECFSEENIMAIQNMGYGRNAAIRALKANKDNLEAACNWIFQHADENLDAPLEEENAGGPEVNQGDMFQVMEMGFEQAQAKIALIQNKGDVPQAIEWLFNCGGDVTPFLSVLEAKKPEPKQEQKMGEMKDKYALKAVIVHLGRSVHHGHYVVYIKKAGKWVLFNDDRVTIPEEPVLGKGYIYLYESC